MKTITLRGLFCLVFVFSVVLLSGANVRGQDSDEVKRLKERNELLETKLKLAELQLDQLKKEVEQLKAKTPGGEKDVTKKQSLSDLLPEGKNITGTMVSAQTGKDGTVTFSITDRDGKKFATLQPFERFSSGSGGKAPVVA